MPSPPPQTTFLSCKIFFWFWFCFHIWEKTWYLSFPVWLLHLTRCSLSSIFLQMTWSHSSIWLHDILTGMFSIFFLFLVTKLKCLLRIKNTVNKPCSSFHSKLKLNNLFFFNFSAFFSFGRARQSLKNNIAQRERDTANNYRHVVHKIFSDRCGQPTADLFMDTI
jgi:hypothetical protein